MGIKFILSIVFLALTAGGLVMTFLTSAKSERGRRLNKKSWTFISVSVICLVMFALVPGSVFTISTGELGVVRVFGEAKEVVFPGIHFRLWITNTIDKYDVKVRELPLDFYAYSRDAQTVSGTLSVQYQIIPDKVLAIAEQYGSIDILEQKLIAIMLERSKSVFAERGAMEIVETRAVLSGLIENKIIPVLDQYYVTLSMVALSEIEFNEAFEQAVELKMIAEQEKLRSEFDKEKAIIKAEEQLEVAGRESDAIIRRAQGDAEAFRIMQEAWGGLGSEVREAMLRQMFYEKWNGVLPEVMSNDSMDLMIGR